MKQALTPAEQIRLGASALGLDLAGETERKLHAYCDLLRRWNLVFNLTAIRESEGVVVQHILDSLSVLAPLRRISGGRQLKILDVGSGPGLPGAVLAIAEANWRVWSVDAVAKKAHFVRQVALELGLDNLQAVHGRIEAIPPLGCDLAISRAFSSLREFVHLSRSHLSSDGAWVAMKGRVPESEIADLPASAEVFHVEQVRVPALDAARCLVWIRPTGPAHPIHADTAESDRSRSDTPRP